MKTFVKILSMLVAVIMLGSVGVVGLTAYAEPSDVLGQYDFSVVDNPYEDIDWYESNPNLHAFKASTHAHTVRSDGDIELNDTIWEHYMKGYEVLCLTDHGTVNGVDIKENGVVTGATGANGASCGWTENQDRCALYAYQSFVHGNIDEITESDYYDVIKGVSRNGRPQNLVDEGRGFFNLPLGNEANEASGNKCHVNTYNVSVFHGAMRNVEWPESTVGNAYNAGAYTHINHVGEWTDGNGDPSVYSDSWISDYVLIFTRYCPNRTTYTADDNSWNHTNVTGQRVKKGVIGMELVNTSDNRTRNDRFYVYDASLKVLAPQGINMYGFCEDDSHEESDVNKNAQYFLVNDGTAWSPEDKAYYGEQYQNASEPWVGYTGDITRSMTNGEFYACSVNSKNSYELGDGFNAAGPYPSLRYFNIDEESDQITLKVTNSSKVRLVADGNIVATKSISETDGETVVVFDLNAYENNINSYVRIYMTGKGGITYLQPILLSKAENKQSYVQFILPSADTTLEVYNSANELVETKYTDNMYVLPAGDYTYVATRKGYLNKTEAFTVTQAEIDAGTERTIEVTLEKDENISFAYFYAPETIYLDPADNKTFKYYVDRENADNGNLIASAGKTTGNVYFHREGASNVKITYSFQEGATSIAACSLINSTATGGKLATQITSGSLSETIANGSYVLIQWKAEYTYDNKTHTSYTYSYVYPTPKGENSTLSAGSRMEIDGPLNSPFYTTSSVFAYGLHKVESTQTIGYEYAPYYKDLSGGDNDPYVSGSGYTWGTHDTDGSSAGAYVTSGDNGYIYADKSRINNFNQVPLFKIGYDINNASGADIVSSGDKAARYLVYFGDASNVLASMSGTALNNYTGKRVYLSDNSSSATALNYTMSDEEETKYIVHGEAVGAKELDDWKDYDSAATSSVTVYVTVIRTDKGTLRTTYNNAIANAYQQDWFTSVEEYNAYRNALIAAAKVLGNPAATPDEINTATNNLKNSENSVQLKNGTAQVKHHWSYKDATGEIFAETPYSYKLSDTLVANSTEFDGFRYAGRFERKSDGNVITTGSAVYESITAAEENYEWIFYYTPIEYLITYSTGFSGFTPNGGSGAYALYGQDYVICNNTPSRAGYTFSGWYLDLADTVYGPSETVRYDYLEPGTFIAQWVPLEYTVSYDLAGGEFNEGQGPKEEDLHVVYDQTYTICTGVPEKEGYNFLGWSVNGGEIHTAGSQFIWDFAANATLVAQWANADYEVTYEKNVDDATVTPASAKVYYDKPYGTLATANRTGYTYQWYSDPNCQDSALVTSDTIVKIPVNHTLYAKWTPITYTIAYNLGGGFVQGVNPTEYTIESNEFTLINPTKTGYAFSGWSGTDISAGTYSDKVVVPSGSYGNRTYDAHWTAIDFKISYNLNVDASSASEATHSNPEGFTYADNITIRPATRLGYSFDGWTGEDYTSVQTIDIPAGTYAKDLSFTANWTLLQYSISYDLAGGSAGVNSPTAYNIESAVTVSDPTRTGYTFHGWRATFLSEPTKDLTIPAGTYGDILLTAMWVSNKNEIVYDLAGGSVNGTNPTEYKTGEKFTLINPTRTGYDFGGWMKHVVNANTITGPLMSSGIVDGDSGTIIFTATWIPTVYTITYDLKGGHDEIRDTNNITEYTAETPTFTLSNPIKEGYIFAGWTGTDVTGVSKSVTVSKGSIGNRYYEATWNLATYYVSYDFAGGASTDSCITNYTYETPDKEIGAPIRTGYNFAGWTQTLQDFTWRPGKLDADGYYVNDSNYYMSSPILIREGFTYTMDALGDLTDVEAHFFGAHARTHQGSVTVGDGKETFFIDAPEDYTGGKEIAVFVYFVVKDEFLESAYRDSIKITVVDDDDNFAEVGKQEAVSVPQGSTGNFKLAASWDLINYSITYDLDGGALPTGVTNPEVYNVETESFTLVNPTKLGYSFQGWEYNGAVNSSVTINQGSTGDRSYKAKWAETMYTISYDLGGGFDDGKNRTNYYSSTETFTLYNPTRTGYTFEGWLGTGISSATKEVTIVKGSTGNRSYVATWTPDTYNIVYSLGGGTNAATNPNTYTFETETFTLAQPTKAGASFAGWLGSDIDGIAMTVTIPKGSTGNREYTATWSVSNYTITYNMAGGTNHTNNPSYFTVDTDTFTLGIPSRTGYSFAGWTGTGLTEATEYVTIAKGSTGNRNYTATWTPISYNINYDLGSGAQVGVANPTSYTIESATFTLNNPVRPGYTFTGWSGSEIDGSVQTVTVYKGSTGNRSYTANWAVEEYQITYVLNGGTAIGNPTTYTITSPDIKLNNPTRTGYEFTAWSGTGITGDGFAKEVIIPTGSSGNRTYTANWKLVEYTITYVLDGGAETIANPIKYNYLTAQITLHNPVRAGYEFVGWVDADDETERPQVLVIIPTNSTGNRHFTAKWDLGKYTISYDLDGGKWPENHEEINDYTYDRESIVVPQPSKEGYVFAGWSGTGISGTSMDLTIHQYSTGNRSYKAHWSEGENIITYDLDGGRLSGDENPTSYVTGSGNIILNNPVKSGYRFAGWIGSNGTTPEKEVVIDTSNGGALSFTATWTPVNYKITYTLGGGALPADVTNPATYTVEDQVILNNPVRTGYTFKGWTGTDLAGAQPTVIIVKGSTGARAYTAVWEEEVYTISYDYGAGSVAISNPFEYTFTTPTFALNNPTLTGYDFIGWSGTGIDGKAMTVVIEKGSTGNRSYTANYKINFYTIKYLEVEGATFTNAPTTYTALDRVVIPNPTKTGYIFKGWSGTGINGIKKDVVIEAGSAGNRVYTAEWEVINYSITYDLNSGRVSGINPATYTVESADISVLNPGRAGYDFEGWTLSIVDFIWSNGTIGENGGIADGSGYYSMIVSLRGNTTYTFADNVKLAVYKTDGTFIEFADKGSYTATEDCVCSVVVGAMTEDELKSVAIVADGNVDNVTIPRGNMGSLKLVANWKSQEFTITYYLNSGSLAQGVTNPEAYNADTADFTLNNPTRTGYIFSGWTGTGLDKATTTVTVAKGSTGNRVYTANWRIERYSLSIDLNGGSFGTVKVPESYTIDTPTFTLPIPVKSNNTFTGWLDGKGVVHKTVTITKGSTGDLSYEAQWSENQAGTHKFYYYGMNNQLIGVETVEIGKEPMGRPYQVVIGYEFAGWSVNLKDKAVWDNPDDIHVYSTYKVGPDTYTVKVWVDGKETVTTYSQYATVKVSAPATSGNASFSHWAVADESGNATTTVVSYYQSFSFKAHANISVVAVYGSASTADKVTTRITKAEYNAEHKWISFYAERSVDSAYTVLQHGIMFTDDVNIAQDSSKFILGTSGVYASTASSTSRSGVYTLSIGGLESDANTPYAGCNKLYARSYIKYVDANGETQTVYSDISVFTDEVNCLNNFAKNLKSF